MFHSTAFSGYRCALPGLKRPGPKVNHSTTFSAEANSEDSYACISVSALMAWAGESLKLFPQQVS